MPRKLIFSQVNKKKRLGYFRKSSKSNKRLIKLFEANQKARYAGNWEDKNSVLWQE